jgi:Domain of unknown function (DUF4160)
MPELSRFFGIIITLYYNDHPPPHFHVRYGKQKAIVGINPLILLKGELSTRTWNLVKEWAIEHQVELLENWELARLAKTLEPIEPLE